MLRAALDLTLLSLGCRRQLPVAEIADFKLSIYRIRCKTRDEERVVCSALPNGG